MAAGGAIVRTQAADGRPASPIQAYLEGVHRRYASVSDGQVATYIPELAKANPEWFGICLATTDGHVYEVGDARQRFTIQSISKPFVYGLALEDHGRAAVLGKIGVEPTGDAFNSISLAPGTGCPLNPMINAGAIASSSLVAGHSPADKLARLLTVLSLYAGRGLDIDDAVYVSERETGHRNRAIGHMLRNFDIIPEDPTAALDLYFRQCSVSVDCRDLSVMAATLANGGVNPVTGERALPHDLVESVLSVMTTCGMYDYAGEWFYWVGMPAKSGVGGGVLAVLPGQLGVGVFSPPLDARGNSVRGVAVCKALSRDFNLHALRVPRAVRAAVRIELTLADVASKRLRSAAERAQLDAAGTRARIYEFRGDVGFAALEAMVRGVVEAAPELAVAVIDCRRVSQFEECAAPVLVELVVTLGRAETPVVLVGAEQHPRFLRGVEEGVSASDQWGRLVRFADLDPALEWCENRVLGGGRAAAGTTVALAEHAACRGLSPEAVATLEGVLERRSYAAGDVIVHRGEVADQLFLLTNGQVSVTMDLPEGRIKRLSTLSPGMVFGELAFLDRATRTADVRADTAVECRLLSADAFAALGTSHPAIKITILENLLRNAARVVARLNHEVASLAR